MPPRLQFSRDEITTATAASRSYAEVARRLGYAGRSSGTMVKRWIEAYGLSVDHFGGPGVHTGRSSNIIYTRESLAAAVAASNTYSDVCRHLGRNPYGGTHRHIVRLVKQAELDTSHFFNRSESGLHRYRQSPVTAQSAERVFVVLPPGSLRTKSSTLRKWLVATGTEERCGLVDCPVIDSWNGKPLTLQVDHINGKPLDNRRENLRFLCPNCHSQQPTTLRRGRHDS